jgi:hypothetical protein
MGAYAYQINVEVGIAFATAIVFTSQAFASDLPDCPKGHWEKGHYICGDLEANS